jgi:molybdopterin-guanine dinucleotide biosynthesis protein A
MGAPKALAEIDGRPMIARVAGVVGRVATSMTIVSDRAEELRFLGLPVIPDLHAAAGPLGGLHAALTAARSEVILLVSCDLPFLTSEFLSGLIRRHGPLPATVPRTDRLHPVCALYDRSLAALADRVLQQGRRSMLTFLESVGYEEVDVASMEPRVDPLVLTNVNDPDELAAARRRRS